MQFTIGTWRITCFWGNIFVQLLIFLIGRSEVCGRRTPIGTKDNGENPNNLDFNNSSTESLTASALTNAISDNLELDGESW